MWPSSCSRSTTSQAISVKHSPWIRSTWTAHKSRRDRKWSMWILFYDGRGSSKMRCGKTQKERRQKMRNYKSIFAPTLTRERNINLIWKITTEWRQFLNITHTATHSFHDECGVSLSLHNRIVVIPPGDRQSCWCVEMSSNFAPVTCGIAARVLVTVATVWTTFGEHSLCYVTSRRSIQAFGVCGKVRALDGDQDALPRAGISQQSRRKGELVEHIHNTWHMVE